MALDIEALGLAIVTKKHVPFFQGIVQVTVPLPKFRNSSFLRSFSNCWNGSFLFLIQFLLHIHTICKTSLTQISSLVYSEINFNLFHCSIELFGILVL